MKAAEDLDFKNYKAFPDGATYDVSLELPSSFKVKKGEVISEKLKEFGYSEKQIKDSEMNILKGNPHFVVLEDKKDEEKAKTATEEKEAYDKRFNDLKAENKAKQVEMLNKLNSQTIPRTEGDRIRLIMELEQK